MNGKRKGAFLAAIVLALGQAGVVQGAAPESITLSDSYVKADYDEVSQLKDTKQVIVITRKDMEGKGYRTLSDVLNGQTSINTGAAGYGKIDIRGQGGDEADRNLVFMVDGVPLNNMSSHPWSLHYDVIPVENVEKIEIIPGGGSVLYGSGASGGVINVTTQKKAGNQKANSVFSEWNSYGYRAGVALSQPVNDQLSIQADIPGWSGICSLIIPGEIPNMDMADSAGILIRHSILRFVPAIWRKMDSTCPM